MSELETASRLRVEIRRLCREADADGNLALGTTLADVERQLDKALHEATAAELESVAVGLRRVDDREFRLEKAQVETMATPRSQ